MRSALILVVAASSAFMAAPSALGQPITGAAPASVRARGEPAPGWTITAGIAPVFAPAWQGSRDTSLSIFPDVRIAYKDRLFASIPDGLGWNAVAADGWKAGPIAKLRFGRKEASGGSPFLISGGSTALAGLGDIGAAGEIGGFVEKRFGPRRQWRVRTEVRHGFGGHNGVLADASFTYQARSRSNVVNIGPRATFASAAFMQRYYGIDAGQSLRSGLARHDAGGGLLSLGVGASAIRDLGKGSAVTLFTGLDRLGGEPARSPLIAERGRRNQFTLGLGYAYRFRL